MARSRARTDRRTAGLAASFVLLLTTIASLFVAQLAPAFALARLAGGSLEGPTVSVLGERESISVREARTKDGVTIKRAGRGVDRIGPEPTTPDLVTLPAGSLASIAPLDVSHAGPTPRVTWESPTRHRARLMVFLN